MKRWARLLLLGAVALGLPSSGNTQVAALVYDPANWAENLITAVQTVIVAAESVTQTAQGVDNLLPLDEIAIAGDLGETIGLLMALIAEGQALMGDVQSAQVQITALFGLNTIPQTPRALTQRIGDMQQLIFETHVYAWRVQTLIGNLASAMQHIQHLVGLLQALAGNKQNLQLLNQQVALANQTLAAQTLQTAAYQRAQILTQMERRVVVLSWSRIHCEAWSDWPGFTGCREGL